MDRRAKRIQPGDANRRTDRFPLLRQRPAAARTGSSQVPAADESKWPDSDARREFLYEIGPRGRSQALSRRTDFSAIIAYASGSGCCPKKRRAQLGSPSALDSEWILRGSVSDKRPIRPSRPSFETLRLFRR